MIKVKWFWFFVLFLLSTWAPAGDGLSKKDKDWLKMVDFIITSEERRIFRKKMKTGYEREQFIKLFWAKRDPDLTDNVNPFRDEFLARYDYVMTHFETLKKKIPKDERSYIYLLLGPPTTVDLRIDVTIMGTEFRNKIFQHNPELWTYETPKFNYKKKKIKIQMVPRSSFGDYTAFSDNYTINWLRQLKYRYIVNPDLETPPLNVLESRNYQDTARVAMRKKNRTEPPKKNRTEPPKKNRTEPPKKKKKKVRKKVQDEGRARTEKLPKEDVAGPVQAPAPPRETALVVPGKVNAPGAGPKVTFTPETGNPMELTGALGFFKSSEGRNLVLGRMGFPLKKLDFDFVKNQYEAPFVLEYGLFNSTGEQVVSDSVESQVLLPDLQSVEKKNTYYSKEFAAILTEDHYTLKIQLQSSDGRQQSFFETDIEVPVLGGSVTGTTHLLFLDPNVNPETAKFNVDGKPFSIHLSRKFRFGKKMYPALEIVGQPDGDTLDTVQIHAVRGEEIVHTWVLYPEEMTPTNHGTVLVHPVLRTRSLAPGAYRLRFEMELPSGALVLAEDSFNIMPRE